MGQIGTSMLRSNWWPLLKKDEYQNLVVASVCSVDIAFGIFFLGGLIEGNKEYLSSDCNDIRFRFKFCSLDDTIELFCCSWDLSN